MSRPCFYCGEPVEGDAVHGVQAIAHRRCVHEEVVEHLRDRHPEPPNAYGRLMLRKLLREAGVTEAELWG